SISDNFQSDWDLLSFTNDGSTMGNITASYDAATGVLSLSSAGATATLAQWQAALRAISYVNTSETPNAADRTISFEVYDGDGASSTATRAVSVTAVNDAPVVITGPASVYVEEDVASSIWGLQFSDEDADTS